MSQARPLLPFFQIYPPTTSPLPSKRAPPMLRAPPTLRVPATVATLVLRARDSARPCASDCSLQPAVLLRAACCSACMPTKALVTARIQPDQPPAPLPPMICSLTHLPPSIDSIRPSCASPACPFSSVLAPRGATALPTHTRRQCMHAAWQQPQASDTHTHTRTRARMHVLSHAFDVQTHARTHAHARPFMHATVTCTHQHTDTRMHTHAHAHSLRTQTHTRTHRPARTNKRTHRLARTQGCAILEESNRDLEVHPVKVLKPILHVHV